jgi:predicted transglutaminase-like cysteine proteinase
VHGRVLRLVLVLACGLLALGWPHGRLAAFDAQRLTAAAQALGPRAVAGARALVELISRGSRATDESRVQATNKFFNDAIAYVEDIDNWGETDYWATPLESLGRGAGDCEDYALAKYFTLAAMGVPPSKLRMVYVRAQLNGPGTPGVAHMVLAYYPAPGAEPLILDNLVPDVRPASRRPDLSPVYSFNTEGQWDGTSSQPSVPRLSRWPGAMAKIRAEGF